MSGSTTREVIESTVPLPLARETITPLDTEVRAARLRAHTAPFRPGLALSSITLLRQSTMNHFWPMVLRLMHLLRSTCTWYDFDHCKQFSNHTETIQSPTGAQTGSRTQDVLPAQCTTRSSYCDTHQSSTIQYWLRERNLRFRTPLILRKGFEEHTLIGKHTVERIY